MTNLYRTARVCVLRPPSGTLPLLLYCFPLHPARQTFLVAAELTTIPLPFVDNTISLFTASVCQILPHRPLEETFATFATGIAKKSINNRTQNC